MGQPERRTVKRSIFALGRPAFRSLSPPDARFPQNLWESGTRNRVPKYGWLSGAGQAFTYWSFFGRTGRKLVWQPDVSSAWSATRNCLPVDAAGSSTGSRRGFAIESSGSGRLR
jgi:hypothetical protein